MPASRVHHSARGAFVGDGEGGGDRGISDVSCDIVGGGVAAVLVGIVMGTFVITVVAGVAFCGVITCIGVVVDGTETLIAGFSSCI